MSDQADTFESLGLMPWIVKQTKKLGKKKLNNNREFFKWKHDIVILK